MKCLYLTPLLTMESMVGFTLTIFVLQNNSNNISRNGNANCNSGGNNVKRKKRIEGKREIEKKKEDGNKMK
ncbi:hypothetical protein Goshw_028511, partial [Gossypium schwendimanii]|nr:hypothetical protein [Gossypium schwendimanii]